MAVPSLPAPCNKEMQFYTETKTFHRKLYDMRHTGGHDQSQGTTESDA
jgi:hypothetical protein